MKIIKRIINKKVWYIISIFILSFTNTIPIQAVSDFYSENNIQFYDPSACNPNSDIEDSEPESNETAKQPVFILGDSIMQGAWYSTGKLKEALSIKGITEVSVDAQGSRSIHDHKGIQIESGSLNTTPTTGMDAVEKSNVETKLKAAKTVVVALGTNQDGDGSTSVYKDRMSDLINKIKSKNKSASIFVLNIFSTGLNKMDSHNNMLEALSSSLGFSIIDLSKSNIPLDGENIHPKDSSAYEKYSEVIVDNLRGGKSSSSSSSPSVKYSSRGVGNIAAGGRTAKASIYGGTYKDGRFIPTNAIQDPSGKNGSSDDSGVGNRDNKLPGTSSFAELSVSPGSGDYSALGKLPNGTKLEITYKGKRVIAEKADVGAGGDQRPEIDLWWEVAEMLDFTKGIDSVKIRPVAKSTPLTEVGSGKTAEAAQDESSGADACVCSSSIDSSSSNLVGSKNSEKAFNFFVSKGWTKEQSAGIVGNLLVESNIEPMRKQSTPSGTETPADKFSGGSGWGIAQWTPGSKFINPIKAAGKDPNDLQVQLETIDEGLRGQGILKEKLAGDQLKTTDSAEDAAEAFQGSEGGNPYFGYERPASRTATISERKAKATLTLREYGSSAGGGYGSTVNTSSACVCEDNSGSGSVDVVLDPGHSGIDRQGKETDPNTGLYIGDSSNGGERQQVWEVAEKVKSQLEKRGYRVIMTKDKEDSYVNLKERAAIANKSNAAIAVSIHNTGGGFGSDGAGWVTHQKVGGYRENNDGTKKTFTDSSLADLSKKYADSILEERKKIEGGVQIHDLNFDGRPGLSGGNLSIVQLFSKVPWVYNEVGQTGFNADKYSEGITNGIEKALGSRGVTTGSENGCSGGGGGDLINTIKAYAWPDYHPARYLNRKPAWAKVADNPDSHYVGGTVGGVKGIDCGGFVTMTIRDSGIDTNYNPKKGSTDNRTGGPDPDSQWGYLDKNWKKLKVGSTSDLQPGDVAINSTHTFLYVGKIPGFNDVFASASYSESGGGRSPMAGQGDAMTPGKFNWYRKK